MSYTLGIMRKSENFWKLKISYGAHVAVHAAVYATYAAVHAAVYAAHAATNAAANAANAADVDFKKIAKQAMKY